MARIGRSRWGQRRDERGATLIFTAMCMVLLLWAGALGVDVGFSVYGSRQAQAMSDTAALDLARYINIADAEPTDPQIQTYLNGKLADAITDNASDASLTVTPGLWQSGTWSPWSGGEGCAPSIPAAQYPCNAVQVTATQTVPQIFYGGFNTISGHAGASTIAALTPEAGFDIGTYPASFNAQQTAVLNALLSVLGSPVNLTAAQYQALATTYVTVGQLVTASGLLTASNVMTQSEPASNWQTIWEDAIANQVAELNCSGSPTPSPCTAGTALASMSFGSPSAQLCQLVSVNGSTCLNGGLNTPALSANLDVLQMLTTEAELANGSNTLNVTSALNLTYAGLTISKVTLALSLGAPPSVRYGAVGTTATSPQIAEDLQITLAGFGVLDIPLTQSGVSGTAGPTGTSSLTQVNCTNNALTSVKINSTLQSATGTVTLAGTSVATLKLASVTGSKGATSYGPSVIPPTASTSGAGTNPESIGSSSPTFSYSGVSGSLNSTVETFLESVVPGAVGPVLQAVGVTVGGAQVAALNTECDAVSIVQ